MQAYAQEMRPLGRYESIDTQTAAFLMNCSCRHVRRLVASGDLCAEYSLGVKGGKSGLAYRIPVSALPIEAQLKWRAMQHPAKPNLDLDLVGYRERYGQEGLNKLVERQKAVEEANLLRDQRGDVLARKKAIADRIGISVRQLYLYQKAYEAEGWAGLMDKTARADKGRPRCMCLMAQDYIQAAYCTPGKVLQNKVTENLQKLAKKLGCGACDICPHNPGSLCRAELIAAGKVDPYEACDMAGNGIVAPANRHAVNRFVASIPQAVRDAGRKGWAYWEKAYMPKAIREKPERVNEVWFGDHHQFDLFVLYNGKPVRPWLTAWMDAKSNTFPGWVISLNPNSDTIVEALTRGIAKTVGSPFSGVPEMLYIDNGKDYRCRRIEGDGSRDYSIGQLNIDCNADNALLKSLGIGVTHAIPYRAWSKTIERVFGTIERRWIQGQPGWCGHNAEDRPEKLNEDIRKNSLLTFEDFVALWVNQILPEYHSFKAEGVAESPLEIYQSSEKARSEVPSWGMMAIAKSLRVERKVTTSGVRLDSKRYYHPALAAYIGSTVTVLYNRNDDSSVTILQDGRFICEAGEAERYKLVGESQEKLEAHMREQQKARRAVREALRLPTERVQMLDAMAAEIPDLAFAGNITSFVHERAYRGQQEGKARLREQKEARTAASAAAGSNIRSKWAAEGQKMLRDGNGA